MAWLLSAAPMNLAQFGERVQTYAKDLLQEEQLEFETNGTEKEDRTIAQTYQLEHQIEVENSEFNSREQQLQNEVASLERLLQELQQGHQQELSDLAILNRKAAVATATELATLKAALEREQEERTTLKASLTAALLEERKQVEALHLQLDQARAEILAAQAREAELTQKLSFLHAKEQQNVAERPEDSNVSNSLHLSPSDHESSSQLLFTRIHDLESQLSSAQQRFQADLQASEDRVLNVQQQLALAHKRSQEDAATISQQVESLEQLQAELLDCKAAVTAAEARVNVEESRVKELVNAVAAAEERIKTHDSTTSQLVAEADARAQAEIAKAMALAIEANERRAALETQLAEAITGNNSSVEVSERTKASLEKQISTLEAQLQESIKANQLLQQSSEQKQAEAGDRVKALEVQLAEFKTSNDMLSSANARLKSQAIEADNKLNELRGDIARLNESTAAKQSSADNETSKLDKLLHDVHDVFLELLSWLQASTSKAVPDIFEGLSVEITESKTNNRELSHAITSHLSLFRSLLKLFQSKSMVFLPADTLTELTKLEENYQHLSAQANRYVQQIQRLNEALAQEQEEKRSLEISRTELQSAVAEQKEYIQTMVLSHERSQNTKFSGLTEDEVASLIAREKHVQGELQRLRNHLVTREESFTQDTLLLDERIVELERQLELSKAEHSAQDGNPTVRDDSQHQAHQMQVQKLEEMCKSKQDELERTQFALSNLQSVLDQLQAEHQYQLVSINELTQAQIAKVREELRLVEQRESPLRNTIAMLEQEVEKINVLRGQLRESHTEVLKLRSEINKLQAHLAESMNRLNQTFAAQHHETSVDRLLMKNLLLSYVTEREPKKSEILKLLVKILGFAENEQHLIGLNQKQGLFSSLFGVGATANNKTTLQTADRTTSESFSELWIQFLMNEARAREKDAS